jgi:hypothetical protein
MSSYVPYHQLSAIIGYAPREAKCARASQFSFGPGLTQPGLEFAPPSEGGRYHGKTPPTDATVGVSRGCAGQPGGPWVAG